MNASADVTFTAQAWDRLSTVAQSVPYGYLLGRGALARREVEDVEPGQPAAEDTGNLVLPPAEWMRCETGARSKGWDILGVYQVVDADALAAHPKRHAAVDQGLVLCLVSRSAEGTLKLACFEREEDRFPCLSHARG